MRFHIIDRKGKVKEVLECADMFRVDGSFYKNVMDKYHYALKNNLDIIFSNDREIKQIIINRDNVKEYPLKEDSTCIKCKKFIRSDKCVECIAEELSAQKCRKCGTPMTFDGEYEEEDTNCISKNYTCPACGDKIFIEEEEEEEEEGSIKEEVTSYQIGWLCPACGRGNSPYNSTCPCSPFPTYEVTCRDNSGTLRMGD